MPTDRARAWLTRARVVSPYSNDGTMNSVESMRLIADAVPIILELLAVVERASRDPSLPGWMDTVASGTPCCECGRECIEFSRPSEEWNATMRPDGHETDREYLCAPCYMDRLAARAKAAESARKDQP